MISDWLITFQRQEKRSVCMMLWYSSEDDCPAQRALCLSSTEFDVNSDVRDDTTSLALIFVHSLLKNLYIAK